MKRTYEETKASPSASYKEVEDKVLEKFRNLKNASPKGITTSTSTSSQPTSSVNSRPANPMSAGINAGSTLKKVVQNSDNKENQPHKPTPLQDIGGKNYCI